MNILKYLVNWRYRYFLRKRQGVRNMIEDLEFKKYKTLEIREEIRQEYTNMQSRLEVLKTQIVAEKTKSTLSMDEQKRLDDQKVLLERDSERLKEQIKNLDIEVHGSNQTNEYPDGVNGVDQQLESLHELIGMLNSWIAQL